MSLSLWLRLGIGTWVFFGVFLQILYWTKGFGFYRVRGYLEMTIAIESGVYKKKKGSVLGDDYGFLDFMVVRAYVA